MRCIMSLAMIAEDRHNKEANHEESFASGQRFWDASHFCGATLIFLPPLGWMIHSSLKLWWDAEWKQMRACQTWQEKLISSQPLAGFWFKRSGVSVPSPQPSTAARTVMGSHRHLWGAFVSASSNGGGTLSQRDPKRIFFPWSPDSQCRGVHHGGNF